MIGYVCIYIVSVCDYVSNVNFSVSAPERTPDNNRKQQGAKKGVARGGAGLGLQ